MNNAQKTPSQSPLLAAVLLLLSGSILFSSKAVLVKLAYRYDVDSLSLLALRMLFALPMFFFSLWLFRKKNAKLYSNPISKRDGLTIALLGILGFFVASLLDFIGLQYVSAGMERLILFTYPTIVLLLNALLFKIKITPVQILALGITYFGISIAFFQGISISQHPNFVLGGALIFGCAIAYATFLVGSGRLLPRIGTMRFTTYAMAAAGSFVLIYHGISMRWQLFDFAPQVYLFAFLMALFATVLPSFMISEGIRRIGANNAAILGSIGPISTIILAYIFLDERLEMWQWLGTFFVLGGIFLISRHQ